MKLSNKIAVVTGGTSGIGLEAAKLFRDEGATVIVVGRNTARLEAAAAELGKGVTVLRGDVSRPADIESIIEQVRRTFGRIDVLFANAGLGHAAPLEAVTEAQIDEQFSVNVKGVFVTVQKAVPLMGRGGASSSRHRSSTRSAPRAFPSSRHRRPRCGRWCARWARNSQRAASASMR